MNEENFKTTLNYVIHCISLYEEYEYDIYIKKNPHYQYYFDILCELYDVLNDYPSNDFINNNGFHISHLYNYYSNIREFVFSNDVNHLINVDKLASIFESDYHKIFTYYENMLYENQKEEYIIDSKTEE